MKRQRRTIRHYFMLTLCLLVGGLALFIEPAYADEPPADYACRECHDGRDGHVTLPSGETLPLDVPLAAFDQSAHAPDSGLLCTSCHTGLVRYQYPHQPPEVQTKADYQHTAVPQCEDCHYAHNPFHPADLPATDSAAGATLPMCVDCHTNHNIAPVEAIPAVMPEACLACHTDQPATWTESYFPTRPGWGDGAAGYVGSARCASCHDQTYHTWQTTLHANLIQNPATNPNAIIADFNRLDPDLGFTEAEVAYTIGSRWKQQYLTQTETGDFYILPAQWNVETETWTPYHPDDWQTREWRQECGTCHVTGLDMETGGFVEFGIGCESCHGPAAEHVADPEAGGIFAEVDDQVCGACHSRGKSPEGYPFPATYRPGDVLSDHFSFTTAADDLWPDGSAKQNHQQYLDWQLGSPMALSNKTNCVSCHAVHDNGASSGQLVLPGNEVCLQCHEDKRAIIEHAPYHDQAASKHDFLCSDCHMPEMATSAVSYDIHNHSFLQPNPENSLAHGGLQAMPNACNNCHTTAEEGPIWATETIAYVKALATPAPASIFGPGPTPTSPPPPTPLPSVGEKPDAIKLQVETGRWLRNLVFGIAGIVVLFIGYGVYQLIKERRQGHV